MIRVTKTFLPPQEEYQAILKKAWDSGWITNRGVLIKELEEKLKNYLQVPNIIATTNGTLPLQIAIKALGLKGEIITTPFSYVATTSSIVWEGCSPVFVDIHPEYLTIDETKIEAAITSKTTAILATHVFGNPCDVETIQTIAKKHNLKVIYDAAHCFGVTYKNQSIFKFGDISTCSFHATKLFHTGEGGAMFTNSEEIHDILFYQHNFGHQGPESIQGIGINAKMSELQAALGLSVLPYLDIIMNERRSVVNQYNETIDFSKITTFKLRGNTNWNYSYYPILFKDETVLLKVQAKLIENNIIPRRYFYPSLNTLDYINSKTINISESIASRVLCLPLYVGLKKEETDKIVEIININV
ncbi:DegT/DnrJ/EryC1/StrS family aminotransferase [Flavobacteriaceae bacterium S0825]|uniref:DegT/DnrJ/EryC1/StrS family aminotransferase n=1 Tax=Gaetbulibacter sp. S0825 TaxID=2720084 RepID=UPI00142F54BA|nr:DegT/DnrJ/EryC1/StrS family aminotransferase [Gaetbulibacter sp. S0825]MCK0109016.1 DegT/DnrJ/EryC1/StrS family aminotransferase [Flavobacteriaceae bacterium S0825]NIX64651.1 DegT/DnrJ/EryC1/StrS family aminotransferase [Gaetbulibacter sp. S0825]